MKKFVRKGKSYAAKTGEHDDLVMSTLLNVRLLAKVMKSFPEIEDRLSESIDDEPPEPPLPMSILTTY